MKIAKLFQKLEDGQIQCQACIRECKISKGATGYCQTRKNINGKLFSLYYGYFSGIRIEPLKSKPFLYLPNSQSEKLFSPDEKTLSIGGFGCNFKCMGCQNFEVSRLPSDIDQKAIMASPQEIVKMALVQNLKIIAFTWNEPSIMPEMVVDVAKIAKKQGLTTVYVSNGSLSKKHVDLIAPYIDAFRFDIKAGPNIGDAFYRNYCRLQIDSPVKKILETIKYTKSKGKHIEILTVLIPTMTPSCIRSVINTAKWIKHNLGKETPWHLAKFIPAGELLNPSLITPDNLIDYLASVAKLQGLTKINVIKDKGCDCFIPKNVKCLDCDCCH